MVVGAGMTLLEIRDAVVSFASAFDPSLVDGRAARAHVEQAAQIVKAAQAVLALAAARADECNGFDTGGRSPAHELAALTGSSVGEASATLTTGRRLEQQPDLADAARLGVLSPQQTMAISEALAADPSVDARTLVGTAQRSSLRELRDECERVKARGDHDREARRRRIHDERHLRRVTHHDGSAGVVMRGNPEDIARVYAAIAPRRDELFAAARREGRRERSESLDYDALLSTLRSPSCCDGGVAASDDGGAVGAGGRGRRRRGGRGGGNGQRAKILVRVDFDTLLRGYPIDGEVCEIAGYGPVSVGAVHDLLAEGGFWPPSSPRASGSPGSPISAAGRGPSRTRPSSGSTRSAPGRVAATDGSSAITATTGPRPRSPSSTPWIGSAPTTMTSRRGSVGRWCRVGAGARWFRPTTLATPGTRLVRPGGPGPAKTRSAHRCEPEAGS
jgi:hypothetical protein